MRVYASARFCYALFVCALTLAGGEAPAGKKGLFHFIQLRGKPCGLGKLQTIRFFRLRGWRPGGSSGRTLPGGSRPQRRVPRLWTPPLRRAYREFSASLLNEVRRVLFWMERVPSKTARRITGAISKMSGTESEWLAQRQRCGLYVLAFSTSSRHRVQRCVLDLCPAANYPLSCIPRIPARA